jgi:hypothetical protein
VLPCRTDLDAARADGSDAALAEGVADVCQQEIRLMRTTLLGLGHELAEQLSEDGKAPVIDRITEETDERTWFDRRFAIRIAPTAEFFKVFIQKMRGVS